MSDKSALFMSTGSHLQLWLAGQVQLVHCMLPRFQEASNPMYGATTLARHTLLDAASSTVPYTAQQRHTGVFDRQRLSPLHEG